MQAKQGYETIRGGFGPQNEARKRISDFSVASDLRIINTFFKKRDEHLITFKTGSNKSQIDYLVIRGR